MIDFPLILYLIINTFDLPEMKLLFISIPRLTVNRYEEVTSIFSKDFLISSFTNFVDSMKLFIGQSNDHPWNLIEFFGITYVFSLPFTILGIWSNFKKKDKIYNCFNIWFIAAFLLLFICEPNTNRCNCFIIPLIWFTISGIIYLTENKKEALSVIICTYLVAFLCFSYTYFYKGLKGIAYFETDVEEMVDYVQSKDAEKVYIDKTFKTPYIYVLFYSEYDSKDYSNTVEFYNKESAFQQVKTFGKYNFYLPENMDEDNAIYVVQNKKELNIDYSKYDVVKLKRFTILEKKEGF